MDSRFFFPPPRQESINRLLGTWNSTWNTKSELKQIFVSWKVSSPLYEMSSELSSFHICDSSLCKCEPDKVWWQHGSFFFFAFFSCSFKNIVLESKESKKIHCQKLACSMSAYRCPNLCVGSHGPLWMYSLKHIKSNTYIDRAIIFSPSPTTLCLRLPSISPSTIFSPCCKCRLD